MRNRRVTVIGGPGFIGRYVVKRLARLGAVIAVVSPRASTAGYLRPMGDVGQIATIDADLGDEALLGATIEGADAVVNATGILSPHGKQSFDKIHHKGPARLAALARAAGVEQFVHISAIGADKSSASAYARSKAAGEAAVRDAFPAAVILRPSIVFGPEDAFFNRFAEMARLLKVIPLIGGGRTKFQPVYVGDVADAVVVALTRPDAAGKTYELGGPEVHTFRDLMEMIGRETGRHPLLLPLPFGLAKLQAAFLEWLPGAPLTRDQVRLLHYDNVVSPGSLGLADLGITPTLLEAVLPTYVDRFRRPELVPVGG